MRLRFEETVSTRKIRAVFPWPLTRRLGELHVFQFSARDRLGLSVIYTLDTKYDAPVLPYLMKYFYQADSGVTLVTIADMDVLVVTVGPAGAVDVVQRRVQTIYEQHA